MTAYKTYRLQRYLFFWLAIAVYFVPYISVTAGLLPIMKTTAGIRWGIGIAVVLINALPFIGGIFHALRAHFPFVNMFALLFLFLAGFFTLDIFARYRFTFMTIEAVALAGAIGASVLWHFHRKYKRKALTVGDVLKSGLLGGNNVHG